MNNKTLIIIVGVVVIIGAIIGFLMMRNNIGYDDPTPDIKSTSQKMTLKSLLALGKAQTCTFNNTGGDAGGNSSGTMQIANGKMRGDFTTTASGKTMQSHMLMIDYVNYIWGDEMPFGIKMALTDLEKPENQKNQAVDINKELDYACTSGTSDANAFNLPAGVEFKDLGAMMQGLQDIPKTTTGTQQNPDYSAVKQAQCAACDQAPDAETRTQCKVALGCK
ncbi:MAG: hypothetical protein AAB482_01290 [Patescibacteria group bacterium]